MAICVRPSGTRCSPAKKLGRRLTLALLLLLAATLAAAQPTAPSAGPWQGPDGEPLPFAGDEEVLEFLKRARVTAKRVLTGGINRPLHLRLEKDGVVAHAVFRTVDVRRRRARIEDKIYLGFHDSYLYECAAWELSRLLGIDNVPPCIRRRFELKDGTLQLWVEQAATVKARRAAGKKPEATLRWLVQQQTMRLFDALIYNFDRNLGNLLVDAGGKLWFIDHTRSFRKSAEIESLERIVWCERGLWERLRALDRAEVRKRLRPFASPFQIKALFERRDKLVAHLERRMAELGPGVVLVDGSRPGSVEDAGLADADVAGNDWDLPEDSHPVEDPDG